MKKSRVSTIALSLMILSGAVTPAATFAESANKSTAPLAVQALPTVQMNTFMVAMRDGTKLATDVYLPSGGTKFPTLIARTPYGKSGMAAEAKYLAQHGYAVVIQDTRGRGASAGDYYPFKTDGIDGYDTIEWAAAQAWSTGAVGTFGASALGIAQNEAALLNPPHLKAMFVEVASANNYEESIYQGGALRQELIQGWMEGMNVEQLQRLAGQGKITPVEAQTALPFAVSIATGGLYQFLGSHLSLSLADFPYLTTKIMPAYLDMLGMPIEDKSNPNFALQDEENNMMNKLNEIHVPVYHVGGFYDIFEAGVLKSYVGLQNEGGKGARGNQKLLMGPWTHMTLGRGGAGTPWQPNAAINLDDEAIRWFDYWLKGKNNHIMEESRVKYYVTGENQWQTARKWPLPQTEMTAFYLHGGKSGSIQSLNDGSLSVRWPSFKEGSNTYPYDPMNPTMTLGGNNLEIPAGPMDQRPIEQNVLTFTSEPLKHNLTITGPISARLYVSSTAVDTDFTVKITDVAPDGTSINLEDGIIRAKERDGQNQEKFLKPGKIYEVSVDLTGISHQFQPGHRIRVDIASSNYPRFERNNNTATQGVYDIGVVAQNTIYHDALHPSAVFLPVIPGEEDNK